MIEVLGGFIGRWIVKVVPHSALMGNMASSALVWLSFVGIAMVFDKPVYALLPFCMVIIVFSLNEVITGIQAVEQAKECGDTFFTTTKPLVLCGVASMVGALFGNPLAVGLYWGYPGWKKMGSGTGYHLGIVGLYALVGLTGLSAIITAFIPEAVVLPILVFVGISSYSQAFETTSKAWE